VRVVGRSVRIIGRLPPANVRALPVDEDGAAMDVLHSAALSTIGASRPVLVLHCVRFQAVQRSAVLETLRAIELLQYGRDDRTQRGRVLPTGRRQRSQHRVSARLAIHMARDLLILVHCAAMAFALGTPIGDPFAVLVLRSDLGGFTVKVHTPFAVTRNRSATGFTWR